MIVKEVVRKMSTSNSKLKAASQEERRHKWKEPLDLKLGQYMEEEIDVVLKN